MWVVAAELVGYVARPELQSFCVVATDLIILSVWFYRYNHPPSSSNRLMLPVFRLSGPVAKKCQMPPEKISRSEKQKRLGDLIVDGPAAPEEEPEDKKETPKGRSPGEQGRASASLLFFLPITENAPGAKPSLQFDCSFPISDRSRECGISEVCGSK